MNKIVEKRIKVWQFYNEELQSNNLVNLAKICRELKCSRGFVERWSKATIEEIVNTKIGTNKNCNDKQNRLYYDKLILTIPQEHLVKLEYLKDVKNLDSVQGIELLRIYR